MKMPPPFARRVLAAILPPADRRVVLDDLDEEFERRGRAWYWKQALVSVPGAVRLRWRASRRRVTRERRAGSFSADLLRDLLYAWRSWRRQPLFAAAVIVTQALGIGVATAVATIAYTVLVKPLPYAEPSRLVHLSEGENGHFSLADFLQIRGASRTLSQVAGYSGGSRTLVIDGGEPERVAMTEVSDRFFETLGVAPALGRTFSTDDMRREAPLVVMLPHATWARRFQSDPRVVGRVVSLNGQPAEVIGVLPASFEFPLRGMADLWLPMRPSPAQVERGYMHWMDLIGRMAPGRTRDQARAELAVLARARGAEDPKWHGDARYLATPLHELVVGEVRPTILALLGAVALLLATACASIGGLLLTRSAARARELSVRAAIGAGTGRLIRQVITETLLLAVAGGLAGAGLARWLLQAAVAAAPRQQRAALPHIDGLGDPQVVVFIALSLSVATGLFFGLLPVFRFAGHDLARSLRGTRGTAGVPQRRVQAALVAGEVALAFVLLSGTGLIARSVHRLLQVSPGFDAHGLLTMRVSLSGRGYAEDAAVLSFYDRVADRLRGAPGVAGVAAIDQLPLQGRGNTGSPAIEGRPLDAQATEASIRTISANYFEVMGIPIERGRAFATSDRAGSKDVVVVNHTFAERLFAGADPLGQRLRFVFLGDRPWEIVGVVADEQLEELDKTRSPIVYFAMRQGPDRSFSFVLRAERPDDAAAFARRAVAEVDAGLPVYSVATMEHIVAVSGAVFFRKVVLVLLSIFAAASVLLASVAIYSLLAQSVFERTREIGVRLALGAERGDVMKMMLTSGTAPAALGLVTGLAASIATGRALGTLLFDVRPMDPVVLGSTVTLLGILTVAACLVPAMRAIRVDPATTLRQE